MLYATLTFWAFVVVFSAWGVHHVWSGMIKPRVVNAILLPGTLVAQLGYVLGLLVTGNAVRNAMLMSDDERGEPRADAPERQKLPVLGSIVVGLLPILACAGCLCAAVTWWGRVVFRGLSGGAEIMVPAELPRTLDGWWELLRTSVTLMQNMLNAVRESDLPNWRTALFLYLAVCLTVRMAPFPGNRRGTLGAIALAGALTAVAASFAPAARESLLSSWYILSFAVAMLMCLLLLTLLVRGAVGVVQILGGKDDRPARRRAPAAPAAAPAV